MTIEIQNIIEAPFENQMLIREWRNDPRTSMFFLIPYIDEETHKNWLKMQKKQNTKTKGFFCIVSGVKIGIIYINNIDNSNKTGEMGGFMDPDLKNKYNGYGAIFWLLLLKYAFNNLGLYKLNAKVLDNNDSLQIHNKIGARKEGILKEQILKDNKRHDVYIFSYFLSDWGKIIKKYEKIFDKYIER